MRFDILLFGDYWYDLIYTDLARLPELGRELFADGFDEAPGGSFINAVALHRLGLRVGWAADFGNDRYSRLTIEAARREGLNDTLFQYHDRPYRRITSVASLTQDRAFLSFSDPGPRVSAPLKALVQHTARAIFIPGLFFGPLYDSGQWWAHARKMKLIMDCQSTTHTLQDAAVRRAIAHADLFIPNALEAQLLTERPTVLEALQCLGELCPLVVIKDGAHGAYALQAGQIWHAPAIPVTVVDTTGAGDAFAAGFIKAWLDERPLPECLHWGNICGGLSTRARGGATAAPSLRQVEAWLNTGH